MKEKKNEVGLSLIESAMVLALAATVIAGVMFYYQSASDSNKTQAAISEVMSATSAINGLYAGRANYHDLDAEVLINSSAIPDSYKDTIKYTILNPFGGQLLVESNNEGNVEWGYRLALTNLPSSACISLATLNLGTSAAAYAVLSDDNGFANWSDVKHKGRPLSPAEAASSCQDDKNNVVTYFMK